MATIYVEYTARIKQHIHWPDDELKDFNHDNLMANLDPGIANEIEVDEITTIEKNGEDYYF